MPPSSTRRTRTRRDAVAAQENQDPELPDSSPSRPARKRRRTNAVTRNQKDTEGQKSNDSANGINSEEQKKEDSTAGEDSIVNQVVTNLSVAPEGVKAALDHANERLEREYQSGIQAYAKVAGRDWTFYVKKLKVNIGRPPDVTQHGETPGQSMSPPADDEEAMVHIDLGPSKLVSRQHATIEYASGGEETGWQLRVNGRNGVKVNDWNVKRGGRMRLKSGDILEIGQTQVMFVTPDEQPTIHQVFLSPRTAGIGRGDAASLNTLKDAARLPHSSSSQNVPTSAPAAQGSTGGATLAPAPTSAAQADINGPSTPTADRTIGADTKGKHSPPYNRGLMLETTGDIDYSLDSAQDLKPPYSYATMIGQAILASEEEKLTLNSIYQWIMDKYAFYRHSNSGWQNSIRHNLSLNKAFEKVPRRTDEPGKGMKWQIVPSHREEYTKKAARMTQKGGPASSGPSSPASKETLRGATYPDIDGLQQRSPKRSTTPIGSQQSYKEAFTPDRGPRVSSMRTDQPGGGPDERSSGGMPTLDEESPLPLPRGSARISQHPRAPYFADMMGQGSPPTLSSSAYAHEEGQPMITPVPRRQLPRLAPPSTAQLPSAYMPNSSPAPFWKQLDFGSTPARPVPESSPTKTGAAGVGVAALGPASAAAPQPSRSTIPQSSSPPPAPADGKETGSPVKSQPKREPGNDEEDEEEGADMAGIDLARGFQTIGSFHSGLTNPA